MENPLIVITGPTASGKTAISLEVAPLFDGEIIATDSMTVYKEFDIGTDKPVESKQNGIKHYLVDALEPDQEFNVVIFKEMAQEAITKIRAGGKIPFLVGGSTLYIDSLVYNYDFPKIEPDLKLRSKLEEKSGEELFNELVSLDPDAEWTIDKNNKRRLVRALEVTLKSGEPFSKQKSKKTLPKNVLYLAVKREREELYARINKRVDEMMAEGFLEEVEKLQKKYPNSTTLGAAGYRQLGDYLKGNLSLLEAVEKTKQAHRNYAKRQMTWLSGNPDVIWVKDSKQAKAKIADFLAQK